MANFAELVVSVNTKGLTKGERALKETTREAGKTERAVKGTGTAFVKTGTQAKTSGAAMAAGMRKAAVAAVATAGAILGVALATNKFIDGTVELEKVQAQLGAAILSTGGAANRSQGQLNQFAAELQGFTNFGDEAINAMQGLLLTFTQIKGANFDAATQAVLDLSTAMGTDLKSSALQVGKALNDPVLGMTALSRSGIQFTEAQKAVVKAMVATNDIAGAQGIILGELEKQFGGSAEAARATLGGALTSLGNAWGDLFEITGPAADGLRLAIEGLITTITDPGFVAAVSAIGAALFGMAEIGISALSALAGVVSFLGDNIEAFSGIAIASAAALTISLIPAIASATVATAVWVAGLVTLRGALLATGIGALIVGAGLLIGKFLELVDRAGGFGEALSLLGDVAGAVWQGMIDSAAAIPLALDGVWGLMKAGFLDALASMADGMYQFINSIAGAFAEIPSMSALAGTLQNVAVTAGIAASDLGAGGRSARAGADGSFAAASATISGAFAPARDAVAKLQGVVESTPTETKPPQSIVDGLNGSLANVGGAGGKSSGQKQINDDLRAAEKILKDLMTPQEEYVAALEQADRLLKAGVLPLSAYTEHVAQLEAELAKTQFVDLRADVDGFTDALFAGEDGIKNFAKTWLLEMAKIDASNAFKSILGIGGQKSGGLFGGGGFLGGLLSFDGGGDTGSGARSGGVDGKGGFPAILHPNETVVDHTKGGSSSGGGQMDVRVYVDDDGKWQAKVEQISGGVVRQAAPAIQNAATDQTLQYMSEDKTGWAG